MNTAVVVDLISVDDRVIKADVTFTYQNEVKWLDSEVTLLAVKKLVRYV